MKGSRELMRGRGGKQVVVEDEQGSGRFVGSTSNDLHCWRTGIKTRKGPAFGNLREMLFFVRSHTAKSCKSKAFLKG